MTRLEMIKSQMVTSREIMEKASKAIREKRYQVGERVFEDLPSISVEARIDCDMVSRKLNDAIREINKLLDKERASQ